MMYAFFLYLLLGLSPFSVEDSACSFGYLERPIRCHTIRYDASDTCSPRLFICRLTSIYAPHFVNNRLDLRSWQLLSPIEGVQSIRLLLNIGPVNMSV